MGDYEVKEWVSKYLKEGFSEKEIKDYLLSLNYPEEVIDRAIHESLRSKEVVEVEKPKPNLKVYIVLLSIVAIIAIGLLFFFVISKNSKIKTASIQENNFILSQGGKNSSVLMLSGEGEAKITVKKCI